jgi:hypothetical protein
VKKEIKHDTITHIQLRLCERMIFLNIDDPEHINWLVLKVFSEILSTNKHNSQQFFFYIHGYQRKKSNFLYGVSIIFLEKEIKTI